MTETNFRALCEELMNEAIYLGSIPYDQAPNPELIAQARAALAQPDPLAPTNEELKQLLFDDHRSAIEFSCDTKAEGDIVIDNHIDFARAVLAKWGHQ